MNKFITLSFVTFTSIASFTSCNTYHSLNNASTISQLGANPFMQQVAKSVMRNMATSLIQSGINNFGGNLNLGASLSSLLSTEQAVSGFKNMISTKYNIPSTSVENNFSSLGTVKDVVGFVAKNGSGFAF
jgi:hypothetical protein